MKLSVGKWNVIIAALRVAALEYDKDQNTARNAEPRQLRIEQQFQKQSAEARELADFIENEGD